MSIDISRRNFLLGRPGLCRPTLAVVIDDACLARQSIVCRCCGEACEEDAIRMLAGTGGIATPLLVADRCTGCGDCLDICPAQAIRWGAP